MATSQAKISKPQLNTPLSLSLSLSLCLWSTVDVVDSALFVVCLDDSTPKDINETCSNMLCGTYELERGVQVGTCTNRWYEKLQIIVAANGTAGINFEHSGVDGHT